MGAVFFLEAIFRVGPHTVLTGTVKEGVLKLGMKFDLNNKTLEVGKIESMGRQIEHAPANSKIGLAFTKLSESDMPSLKLLLKNNLSFV